MSMKVMRCPTDELSLRNHAAINRHDFPPNIKSSPKQNYVFTVESREEISRGCVGLSLVQRRWAKLSIDQEIYVRPYRFSTSSGLNVLCTIVLEADFIKKTELTLESYDTEQMAEEFLVQFSGQAFTVGQQLAFQFQDKKMLGLVVKDLEVPEITSDEANHVPESNKTKIGRYLGNVVIKFEKAENSSLNLISNEHRRE